MILEGGDKISRILQIHRNLTEGFVIKIIAIAPPDSIRFALSCLWLLLGFKIAVLWPERKAVKERPNC